MQVLRVHNSGKWKFQRAGEQDEKHEGEICETCVDKLPTVLCHRRTLFELGGAANGMSIDGGAQLVCLAPQLWLLPRSSLRFPATFCSLPPSLRFRADPM